MSNTKWISYATNHPENFGMSSKVILSISEMIQLPLWIQSNPFTSLLFGDYTKWCSSLVLYPFNIERSGTYHIQVSGVESEDSITCGGSLDVKYSYGFYLGEYQYPQASSFLDLSPFTKVQVWLPFFGFADLKIEEIQGKYIQFRLFIDFSTGMGQYVIGVSDNSIPCTNPPFLIDLENTSYVDDTNTRIIGTYDCQLGYNIPLGSTGLNEVIRNLNLTAIKGIGSLSSSIISESVGAYEAITNTKETETFQSRNYNTGRMINRERTTKEKISTTNYKNSQKAKRIGTCFDMGMQAINSLSATPILDKSNNQAVNKALLNSIAIITKKVQPTLDISSETYKHIYGKPLGQIKQLSEVSGYTEITNILLEGKGFSDATSEELDILNHMLDGGIILPSGSTPTPEPSEINTLNDLKGKTLTIKDELINGGTIKINDDEYQITSSLIPRVTMLFSSENSLETDEKIIELPTIDDYSITYLGNEINLEVKTFGYGQQDDDNIYLGYKGLLYSSNTSDKQLGGIIFCKITVNTDSSLNITLDDNSEFTMFKETFSSISIPNYTQDLNLYLADSSSLSSIRYLVENDEEIYKLYKQKFLEFYKAIFNIS